MKLLARLVVRGRLWLHWLVGRIFFRRRNRRIGPGGSMRQTLSDRSKLDE